MDLPRQEHHAAQPAPESYEPLRPMPAAAHPVVAGTASGVLLHVCPECSSELVYPVEWAPVDMCHWRVELRCPECEWYQAGLYEQDALDRFDEILDSGTDAMVADLRRLQRTNMEDELARFNLALGQDLILPEDF